MPSVKQQLARRLREVRESGGEAKSIELEGAAFAKLCEEMGTADPVIDGVRVSKLDERASLLELGAAYASLRWRVNMTRDDVASLMKAVPTGELHSLLCIIISQHLDDSGYEDPLDTMSADEHDALKKSLLEIGLVDTTL